MSAEPNVQAIETADPALPPADLTDNKTSSTLPITPEMPGSEKETSSKRSITIPSAPSDISALLSKTDSTIDHLNRLLKSPGGLASFLSTFNYSLYILAHLHSTAPSRAQILHKLATALGRTPPKLASQAATPAAGAAASPLIPLALTLGDLRSTLRLTGLIPLYVLLKSLIRSKEPDSISYTLKLVQCLSYIVFQGLENIYHLTNKTIINPNWTNTRFARLGGNDKLVTWSCRAWLSGITCDFLRLFREAQLLKQSGKYDSLNEEEKREVDKKWYTELFVAMSWFPMAIHYSVEGGIGLNLGVVGACGFFANVGNFLKAWEAAK